MALSHRGRDIGHRFRVFLVGSLEERAPLRSGQQEGKDELMKAGVLKETWPGEARVAVVPAALAALKRAGVEVVVESGAGLAAGFPDAEYEEKGASVASRDEVLASCHPAPHRAVPGRRPRRRGHRAARARPRRGGLPRPAGQPRGSEGPRRARRHRVLGGDAPPHHAGPEHGRPELHRHRRRLQGGAPGRGRPAPHDADAHDRRRHRGPRPRLRDRGRGRRAAGDRHRQAPGGDRRGLRRAPGGQGADREPGREVRGASPRDRPTPRTRAATRRPRTRPSTAGSASCSRRSWRRATSSSAPPRCPARRPRCW